jgi:hypothetical protein
VTIQGQNLGPIQLKGFGSAIKAREGDVWKTRMLTWNITPSTARNRRRDGVRDDHPEQQITS